ncbi:MAG TPA: hypothetical protein VFV66_32920 [Nonomuraea sp.]|nr:hypothetical protein [Nonomuraea sp.]
MSLAERDEPVGGLDRAAAILSCLRLSRSAYWTTELFGLTG